MKDNEKAKAVLKQIGSFPIIDLITSISLEKTKKLADLAVKKFELSWTGISYEDLSNLGTLVSFATENVLSWATGEDISEFLKKDMREEYKKIGCFPTYGLNRWNEALISAYGPVEDWTLGNLIEIGSFIITLDTAELNQLNQVFAFYFMPTILESNEFFSSYDRAPIHTNHTTVSSVCKTWLQEEKESFSDLLESFFKYAMKVSQLRTNLYTEAKIEVSIDAVARKKRNANEINHFNMVQEKIKFLWTQEGCL